MAMHHDSVSKSTVTDKLQQREEERLSLLNSRRVEKQKLQVLEETPAFFKEKFLECQRQIETKLNDFDGVESENKSLFLEELQGDVNLLQKLLTDSTYFLSDFSIKAAQTVVANLNIKIQEKKLQYLPKKKFGFKNKCTKPLKDEVDHIKSNFMDKKEISSQDSQSIVNKKFNLLIGNNSLNIKNLKDTKVTKHRDDVDSKDITLFNLSNCDIALLGCSSAVSIYQLTDCRVFIGPVKSSIFIEECINCSFVSACQQMRIHKTTQSNFFLHVTSRAIIEECSLLKFAPLTWSYDSFEEDFKDSGLAKNMNNWHLVEDFNWLVPDVPSPNWSVLPESERYITLKM